MCMCVCVYVCMYVCVCAINLCVRVCVCTFSHAVFFTMVCVCVCMYVQSFRKYCCLAFNILRKHAKVILNLLSLMRHAHIPDISRDATKNLLKVCVCVCVLFM